MCTKVPESSALCARTSAGSDSLLANRKFGAEIFPSITMTLLIIENDAAATNDDPTIKELRKTLTSESASLARRFRALFSLKHIACSKPPTEQTIPAIQAIAAAFSSPSALLKHELAYCLGQTKNENAVPFLRAVLENRDEDAMCRHEAAEALGALGNLGSIEVMKTMRDDECEATVVRETCEIAVDRLLWDSSSQKLSEQLHPR